MRVSSEGELQLAADSAAAPKEMRVRAVASYPSPGKLLLFNGKLLHGCPPQLSQPQSTSEPRLTLLINIWLNHRPIDIPRLPRFAWRLLRCVAPIPSRGRTATKSRGAAAGPRGGQTDGGDRDARGRVTLFVPVCDTHELTVEVPLRRAGGAAVQQDADGQGLTESMHVTVKAKEVA
uniref:Uncharacterized protein n=1 Tax=Calcidiscus leptoporus TaxID=127549 RepID=A0A7S0NTK3_9EUKA|mmetsp:Transcript_24731/g.57608  ORF Transcript_24731/g.57608 Transcript_24731/m.57608 type:complete len:177 (+) Transcript_24731:125-655(+)